MPLALIFLVAAWAVLFVAQIMEGGKPASLFTHPAPLVLVFGVTMAITCVGQSLADLKVVGKATLRALLPKKLPAPADTFASVVALAEANQKDGPVGMERYINGLGDGADQYLVRGVELIAEGYDSEQLVDMLTADIAAMKERHKVGAEFWKAAGGYAPTIGILGTVMSLVHVLEKLNDPGSLGSSISAAFLATFWGVASANVIYLPLSAKLKRLSTEEVAHRNLVLEGLMDLHASRKAREVKAKLAASLSPADRAKVLEAGKKGS